jgi:hypothetical protein
VTIALDSSYGVRTGEEGRLSNLTRHARLDSSWYEYVSWLRTRNS